MRLTMIVAVAVAIALSPACADFNIGAYARSAAMGGAGLAMVDDPMNFGGVNPAAYAFKGSGFRMMFPSADFRMEGTSLSSIRKDIREATDEDDAVDLAKRLGKQDTTAELSGLFGFGIGPVVLSLDGQAAMSLRPGEGFKAWAESDSVIPADLAKYSDNEAIMNALAVENYGPLADALSADGYYADVTGTALVALPSISFGASLPGNSSWNFGVRMKMLRSKAVFERVVPGVDSVEIDGDSITSIALDFDTDDALSLDEDDSGVGVDLGIIYIVPNSDIQLTTALVMNNIIKPNLMGIGLQRMISVGAAARLDNNVVLAADLVNITKAYDQGMRLRLGAEIAPVRGLAVRAGYGGGSFTYGLGLAGINVAFSNNMPAVVGRAWSF